MFVSHDVAFLEKEFLMDCGDYRKIELDEVNLNIDEPIMEFYFQMSEIPLTYNGHKLKRISNPSFRYV